MGDSEDLAAAERVGSGLATIAFAGSAPGQLLRPRWMAHRVAWRHNTTSGLAGLALAARRTGA